MPWQTVYQCKICGRTYKFKDRRGGFDIKCCNKQLPPHSLVIFEKITLIYSLLKANVMTYLQSWYKTRAEKTQRAGNDFKNSSFRRKSTSN